MTKRPPRACGLWLGLALSPAAASEPTEEVVVEADPGDPVDRVGGVRSVIEVSQLPPSADVAEAIDRAPGAVVQRLGGLGDFAAVSIRGSTTRQVEVLLDGIPLNPDGAATMDLSELPLRAFERVVVYRSRAPLELGSFAVGGVVDLETTGDDVVAVGATGGTFATARGHGIASGAVPGGDALVAVDALSTRGDFTYFDDGGTRFTPSDDGLAIRGNNDTRQVSLHTRWRSPDRAARLTVLHALLLRDEGVPGYTWRPARHVRYGVTRSLPAMRLDGAVGAFRASVLGWAQLRQERFADGEGEIGLTAERNRDDTVQVGGRAVGSWAPSRLVHATAVVEARADRYTSRDLDAGVEAPTAVRRVVRGLMGVDLFPVDRLALSLGAGAVDLTSDAPMPARTLAALPRAGAVWTLVDERLALRGGAGGGLRPPDLTELYGDRGALIGNPSLRPERGQQADLGLVGRASREGAGVEAELVGFGAWSRDRIVWVQNAQQVAMPVNLDRTRALGLEAALRLSSGPLAWSAELTRTWSVNRSTDPAYAGNQLPRVPAWEVQQRLSAAVRVVTFGYATDYVDGNYWDATNFYRAAPRLLHGASVKVADPAGHAAVELEVLNLTDNISERVPRNPLRDDGARVRQAITDFSGYPLPGRTVLLSVSWAR